MICENKPEILAPAGNFDMLQAAVRSGADAVYLGSTEFSARRNAQNFNNTELKKAIDYCHIRGVKTYLTLNILIKDQEMQSAFELAKNAYNHGIDGIIIQDLGLAYRLHELIPNLPLHASTQMSIHSPAALQTLKKLGICRVVVAREMSFDELRKFCAEAKKLLIAVEVFVHGALCMSVSGQCLLSAFLGSRSGNRGLCAGPCRLPFATAGGTGYDLSLKDLSLIDHIKNLYDIGVTSFKIEGRMKRPEYVAVATAACRQALDTCTTDKELSRALENVFSRSGFTSGYYDNKPGRNMFGIRTKDDVSSADSVFPKIHELYRLERHSVKISAIVTIRKGKNISLSLSDGKNSVLVSGDLPQEAQNRATDKESVVKNINKFGSTPYYAESIDVNIDDNLFVRASSLNELRRQACEMLDVKRCELSRSPSNVQYIPHSDNAGHLSKPKIYVRFENSEQIPENLTGIDAVILPLEANPDVQFSGDMLHIADIPRGIISEKAIESRIALFKKYGFDSALCGNMSAIALAIKNGFKVIADTGMNIYNSESANFANNIGVNSIVLSNEILLSDAEKLNSPIQKGIVAYGNIPLMLFKNCPIKNGKSCEKCDRSGVITDRKNIEFPVRCRMGYSELLNSVPIWLADRIQTMSSIDFIVLYFSRETKERVRQVISAYKSGLTADVPYTRGLFYRGSI